MGGMVAARLSLVAVLSALACVATAPAQAAFPGQNGKLVFGAQGSQVVNPDGTGLQPVSGCFEDAAWSPNGSKLVCGDVNGSLVTADPDGSNPEVIYDFASSYLGTDWAPDGLRVVTTPYCAGSFCDPGNPDIVAFALDGSGGSCTACGPEWNQSPAWSPRGDKIAFEGIGINLANVDGTQKTAITNGPDDHSPDWSPDGNRIAFTRYVAGDGEIYAMNPDGSAVTQITDETGSSYSPAWSPDGRKIAFGTNRSGHTEVWVMNRDGSDQHRVVDGSAAYLDWQPIPYTGYARPKGATPFLTYLVPAYDECATPNREHGPPLAFGSCSPPQPTSDWLTVGTADSNGQPTKSVGSVRLDAIVGIPATPADEADMKMQVLISDVRNQSDLSDYTGELSADMDLRITDKNNDVPPGGGTDPATLIDIPFPLPQVSCVSTADPTIGGQCDVTTTVDAQIPAAVKEGKRSIWQVGQIEVIDGGSDGLLGTSPNTVFLKQGIFVP